MSAEPLVSIIIINHYSHVVLGDCLAALTAGIDPPAVEVIIVDNPGDQTPSPDAPDAIPVTRLATPRRIGFGAACNLGASQARGEMLLFLNPDVTVDPSTLRCLFDESLSRGGDTAIVGRLRYPDGRFQPACRTFPTLGNLLRSRGSVVGRLFGAGRRYTLPDYPEATVVEAAAAALMLLPTDTFRRLSGFDERFFMYLEDTDLCYRLHCLGGRVVYAPQAGAVHQWGHATGRYRFRRIVWHHHSVWRYFRKHFGLSAALIVSPFLSINCILSLVVELGRLHR